MAARFSLPANQIFKNGAPLSGGKMYFYEANSLTLKDTYSDNSLSTANANPVTLSQEGYYPNIFLDGSYRVILKDANDVQVWDRDYVNSGAESGIFTTGITVDGDVVSQGKLTVLGDTSSGDAAAMGYTATEGVIITGQGSSSDVTIKNDADQVVAAVPTGTQNMNFNGTIDAAGDVTASSVRQDTETASVSGSKTSDFGAYSDFVYTLTGNLTLPNPSTEQAGQTGTFTFIMGGSGSYTLSVGTDYENEPTLEGAAGEIVIVGYRVRTSGSIQFSNATRYTP